MEVTQAVFSAPRVLVAVSTSFEEDAGAHFHEGVDDRPRLNLWAFGPEVGQSNGLCDP